jgi:hypothetical protein
LTATLGLMTAIACLADLPDVAVTFDQVARGRQLVLDHACADCHSHGRTDPRDPRWLAGFMPGDGVFTVGGQIAYPANLTPDQQTGVGSFSPRQLFNALRYGLDPGATPDGVITSTAPGQGGFPADPHYLSRSMPWPSFRHMPDYELWDIVAYLQHGITAVPNAVPANPTTHPPREFRPTIIGPHQLPAYPIGNEVFTP